jgi:cyclic beta-1,2-glucan synthetase
VSDHVHSSTGDRGFFIGRSGELSIARGHAGVLPPRFGAGLDPCSALHVQVDLAPGPRNSTEVARYQTEPYVLAGDVYNDSAHRGRGGWSWYTGSAGWMYRAGVESILGLRRAGSLFAVDPCIPSAWPTYQIVWQFLETRYTITVSNPERRCRGVLEATLDGTAIDHRAIPLVNDGLEHEVRVGMGREGATRPTLVAASGVANRC